MTILICISHQEEQHPSTRVVIGSHFIHPKRLKQGSLQLIRIQATSHAVRHIDPLRQSSAVIQGDGDLEKLILEEVLII